MLNDYFFFVILIVLSVSYVSHAGYTYEENENGETTIYEDKLSAALEQMKTENNIKLDALERTLGKILEILENKLPERLDKKYHATQDDMNEKLLKVKKNILDNVEEYVDDKFYSFDKHLSRKIDGLQKIVADKTDTDVISHKLDALKKIHLDTEDGVICALTNKTYWKIGNNLNQTLTRMEKAMLHIEDTTTNFNCDELNKKITSLDDKFEQKWTQSTNNKPVAEYIECNNTSALDVTADFKVFDNITIKLDAIESKIISTNENLQNKLDKLNKELGLNITNELDKLKIKLYQNLENSILIQGNETKYSLGCKEHQYLGINYVTPFQWMGNTSLKHVTHRTDSAGLSYFEMHLAVKGNLSAFIVLSPILNVTNEYMDTQISYEIGIFRDKINLSRTRKVEASVKTSFLSTAGWTAFYAKISNGTLEIGVEGSKTALLSYSDSGLKTIRYFSFGAGADSEAMLLYDCPSLFHLLYNKP